LEILGGAIWAEDTELQRREGFFVSGVSELILSVRDSSVDVSVDKVSDDEEELKKRRACLWKKLNGKYYLVLDLEHASFLAFRA